MIPRFDLFTALCGLFCAGVMCAPPESSPPPALRDTDLILSHAGGVAGLGRAIRITPEGQLFASDGLEPEKPLGFLSNEQGNQLNGLLETWDTLPTIVPEPPSYSDGFTYSIAYMVRSTGERSRSAMGDRGCDYEL